MTANLDESALLLGIDLGTARSALASSRQVRAMMATVVGYPKDIIGVKILNQTRVIGAEAIEKRSFLDLCHPLGEGVLKEASERDLEAAHDLLEHLVAMAGPGPGERICGIIGVPARATAANKGALLAIAARFMDIAMVVSEPFLVAYGQDRLHDAIVIDLGAGTIDLCAMRGTLPTAESQVSILKGGDYIDARLEEAIRDACPGVAIDRYLIRAIKEQHAFVGEADRQALVTLRVHGRPVELDVTDAVRMACETILMDIVEQIKRLLPLFSPESQPVALANLVLAGGGSRIRGLGTAIEGALGDYGQARTWTVADPDLAGAEGALKLAMELPPDYWDQVGQKIVGHASPGAVVPY
ncbi:MAG: rod shape-determining protein [Magnetococcales bacterium]|nr:rod shape-determining protein [Magnetococcales bacterium]